MAGRYRPTANQSLASAGLFLFLAEKSANIFQLFFLPIL